MKVYVIQSKNRVMMSVGVSVKKKMIGVFVKMILCGMLARVIVNVIRYVKMINI